MGKGQQYSTEGLGRQQSSKLRVQKHLNHINAGEADTNNFPVQLDFNKSSFDSNQPMTNSNHNATIGTISTTTSKISRDSIFCNVKEVARSSTTQQKESSNFDQPINHQTPAAMETPIFNHVFPPFSPTVDHMQSPFVCPVVTAPNPVTRISSSSSKVSDV